MEIAIPGYVHSVLDKLQAAGHTAFLVGGCVRDSLSGRVPQDWDVATSAAPAQTVAALEGLRLIPTGLRHGTVTAMTDGGPVEVTTFRSDGPYSDGRHPDYVRFTGSLREDLSRRDFTMNAMAYHPRAGLVDPFGGEADAAARVIRCVGVPQRRFAEDALRILRAMRFSAVLGFSVDEATADAMLSQRALLAGVAAERVSAELLALLCGGRLVDVLLRFAPVVVQILPELAPCVGFEQHSPYHRYTVYEHCARAAAAIPPDSALRLAMLLHDCAKPLCCTEDEEGRFHFYGHQAKSAELAREAVARLKLDSTSAQRVAFLVEHHDVDMEPERRAVTRLLSRFGEAFVRELLLVHRADNAAQSRFADRHETYDEFDAVLACVLADAACFSLRNLAVSGHDLIEAGVPKGPAVGRALKELLSLVVEGQCENERGALLRQLEQ